MVRKRSLKAIYLPDRRRVLIDSSQPRLKWRWNEAHEIIHDGIPWHQETMFGDTEYTLSPACHEQIEAEANYGAGRMLFFQDQFRHLISASPLTFDLIKLATKRYGNTMTSTLWRVVEALDTPALGVVGAHPRGNTNRNQAASVVISSGHDLSSSASVASPRTRPVRCFARTLHSGAVDRSRIAK